MKKMVICGMVICILFSLSMLFMGYSVAQEITESPSVKKGSQLLMSTYQGLTVTISGKIDFPGYKKGQYIKVNAKSFPGKGLADIAFVDIPQPGAYSLKVPQNIGDVYITAVILEPGEKNPSKDSLRGKHKDNPLKIGQSDIKGVDIIIKKSPSKK